MTQYFYDKQIRRYIQQFIRLFSGFNVQMGTDDTGLPVFQKVPVRYGDINRMAAHITRENSENVVNSVPFISCYVTDLSMLPERRTYQDHVDKINVFEKKIDETTGETLDDVGNRYTVERHAPVPYNLTMSCDIWTSNTDQKLQLLEQILVLFNPTLDVRTSSNPVDWTALSHVEMTNTTWSSRAVGSSIDDIIDVSNITFALPIFINPPAKLKQQKLIHTIISELYNLDDENLDLFESKQLFDKTTLEYTIVTYEDRKLKFENNKAYLLNQLGTSQDLENGGNLNWEVDLENFNTLRPGISQIRLRKDNDPGNKDNDIIGRLDLDPNNTNALLVDIDPATLPTNTLTAINGVLNPQSSYPGDGNVPLPTQGQRYLILNDIPESTSWSQAVAYKNDIIEYNGANWIVSFDHTNSTPQYVTNTSSGDQLEWNGKDWVNSFEGVYNPGYWRLYL